MSTKHDEKTKAHIKAICDAFAEDPNSVNYRMFPGTMPNLSALHYKPFDYSIRPKPLATGHNPDNLTVEQVPVGERLLDADEIKSRPPNEYIEQRTAKGWEKGAFGALDECTYKTRLSREQLALIDKNEGWIPWFGEGEVPAGMVDYMMRVNSMSCIHTEPADRLRWTETNRPSDIIAYRPAKQTVVPWTIDEINRRVGQIICSKNQTNPCRFVIIQTNGILVWIGGDTIGRTPEYLLENYVQLTGEPCGVKGEK